MRLVLLSLVITVGCVDGFRGSNVQIDLSPATPVQADDGQTPRAGQLPSNVHFKLYAIKEEADGGGTIDRLFELQRFEIHTIVNLTSPCFIDLDTISAPFPGVHITQYRAKVEELTGITDVANPPPGASERDRIMAATAVQRMSNIAALGSDTGIKILSGVSTTSYPAVDANCNGSGLPPPTCIDDAANERRLRLCRETWASDPDLFEGTDRVLTAPLNGTTFGFVVGMNPINLGPVGGAQFFVEQSLEDVDEYALYYQTDGMDGPGTLLMSGRPRSTTRGVQHVDLASPSSPNINANMAIFVDLGEDNVQF